MADKRRKIVLGGDSAFAEVAYEYFTHDSEYEVVGFTVERAFIKKESLFGLPIVAFEDVTTFFPPNAHSFYSAHVYTELNRLRTRFAAEAKAAGYSLASYVSSRAFLWPNVTVGEHCFIFENNVVQPFVQIGSNVVMWSGNHVGHHSVIRDNCFISSHVVISGLCDIGENCFLGVNATVANNIKIAPDCLIGAGAVIMKNTRAGELYAVKGTVPHAQSALKYFRVSAPRSEEPS